MLPDLQKGVNLPNMITIMPSMLITVSGEYQHSLNELAKGLQGVREVSQFGGQLWAEKKHSGLTDKLLKSSVQRYLSHF